MIEKEEFELIDEGVTEEDLFYIDESQEANKINADIDFDGVLTKKETEETVAEQPAETPKKAKTKKKVKTTKKTAEKTNKTTKTKTKTTSKSNSTKKSKTEEKKSADEKPVKTEKSTSTEDINNILKTLKTFKTNLNSINDNQIENKTAILEEFKNLKENFVIQLAQFFDNVSFAEDSEEIKNHVSQSITDNKFELLDEIRQLISEQIEIIINSQGDANFAVNEIKNTTEEIQSKLDTLILAQENGEYSMPELESDIANLRLMLNGIDSVVRDEVAKNDRLTDITNKFEPLEVAIDRVEKEFSDCSIHDLKNMLEVISEDTTSISKRTNKLILTSDDTSKDLKKNVEEFQKVIETLDNNLQDFDIANVKRNLEKLNISVNSILKSNKVMNEAFMHLAEWIDATSDIFDSLKHNSEILATSVQNKEQLIVNLLEEKFEELDEKFTEIEEQINQSNKMKSKKGLDGDLKTTIDFIASQAAAANENSREIKTLYQKIEMIEFQLNKFDKNISKILSYIDED